MNREPSCPAGSRVTLSIISVFGLPSFLFLSATFWIGPFSRLRDFTVVAVAVLMFIGANGAARACGGPALPWTPSDPGSPASALDLSDRRAMEEAGP